MSIEQTDAGVRGVLELFEKLRDASDCTRYLQGGLLLRLRRGDLWRRAFPTMPWWEFCETQVGLNTHTVWALTSIFERATTVGLTPERLAAIGWSKARDVLQVATNETIEEWLAKAERLTRAEVREQVKQAKAGEPMAEAPLGQQQGLLLSPSLGAFDIITTSAIVIVVAGLASLQPAWKASRMDPITALRHV